MGIDALLSRLDRVQQNGRGRWSARCPAHEDHSPSLSIRETDDGRVLVHDFGGCAVADILESVGLDFAALYPERPLDHAKRERRPFPAADVLLALRDELSVVVVVGSDYARGVPVAPDDHERYLLALERISEGADLARGS